MSRSHASPSATSGVDRLARNQQLLRRDGERHEAGSDNNQFAINSSPPACYCAFNHRSDPASLTETSEKKRCTGLPSAVPRCSVEKRRGPAFL